MSLLRAFKGKFEEIIPWFMKKLVFLLLFLLIFISNKTYADLGCQVPDGRVFYGTLWLNQIRSVCPGTAGDTAPYANVTGPANGGRTCIIVINIFVSLTGTEVTYDVLNCNLDDYSWALGLGAGVFGVLVIRRRNKL